MEKATRIGRFANVLVAGFVCFLAACQSEPFLSLEERLQTLPAGFPPIDYPAGNEFTIERWQLGKKLFYDPILSIDSSLSCGSCHQAFHGFADDQALSPGVFGRPGKTNAPSLGNVAFHPYFLREGGVPTLEMQILVPIQEANEFNHNIVDIATLLQRDTAYVRMARQAYNRPMDAFVITRAISAFERSLISGNSPYDQFKNQGKKQALNGSEQRGMELFFSDKASCSQCHGGLNFTQYSFQNNGLYEVYDNIGRMRHTGDSADLALFKVPSLRNAGFTAPYMHDGSIATLEAVVAHYDGGGANHPHKSPLVRPLGLTNKEKKDLVAFLRALSDQEFVANEDFWKD